MELSLIRSIRFTALPLALIALTACGPQLDPNPQTLDFKQVYVGTMAGQNGTWRNSGNANATITGPVLTIAGANAAQFAGGIPAPPPIIVAKGAALAPPAGFGFTPNAVGMFTATAAPAVAEANATVNAMTLQGEGIAQYAVGDLTVGGQMIRVGQPVNFGRVRVGAVSPVVTFDLVNPIGAQNITVTGFKFAAGTQGFAVTGPAVPFVVPRGGRTQVKMTFTPPNFPTPPLEKMFRDGVTFFEVRTDTFGNITAGKSATGVALCGVGFHPSENPPNPPMTCP
jgi:hypothetical protein